MRNSLQLLIGVSLLATLACSSDGGGGGEGGSAGGNPANSAPVAHTGGPYTATEGVELSLDGSGSADSDGQIVAYFWDFGDGNTANLTISSAQHAYADPGTYTVTLTVFYKLVVFNDRGVTPMHIDGAAGAAGPIISENIISDCHLYSGN